MIWIVLVLAVLWIAMSCVALWYRREWHFEEKLRIDLQAEWRITDNRRLDLEFQVEQLKGELADVEVKCRQFRDHINILRSQLPQRDSKGRFVKRE